MVVFKSDLDAVLVAIPMIGVLFAGVFRIDEMFCKPRKARVAKRQFSGQDEEGRSMCVEPDGRLHRVPAREGLAAPRVL